MLQRGILFATGAASASLHANTATAAAAPQPLGCRAICPPERRTHERGAWVRLRMQCVPVN